MNDQVDCTAKISEKTALEITSDVAEIKALAFALIAAFENDLHGDSDSEDDVEMRGTGWLKFDQKAMLRVFGLAFYEKLYIPAILTPPFRSKVTPAFR